MTINSSLFSGDRTILFFSTVLKLFLFMKNINIENLFYIKNMSRDKFLILSDAKSIIATECYSWFFFTTLDITD